MFNWFRKKKTKAADSVRVSSLQKLFEDVQDYLNRNYQPKSEIRYFKSVGSRPSESSQPRNSVKTVDPEVRYSVRTVDPEPHFSLNTQPQSLMYANGQLSWADPGRSPITFAMRVKRYMESKRLKPAELCERVLMDRRLFSKLNTDLSYRPSKETAVAFCIGLRLSLSEAESLLQSAGYSLSNSIKYDVIVRYLLDQQIYDIDDVNAVLYKFGEKCIGC